jgi:hypothetical protein
METQIQSTYLERVYTERSTLIALFSEFWFFNQIITSLICAAFVVFVFSSNLAF